MSFVSFEFLGFFAAVLAGLAVMPTRAARLFLLLIANIVFYGSSSASSLALYARLARPWNSAATQARARSSAWI